MAAADTAVVVPGVVPADDPLAELLGVGEAVETFGVIGPSVTIRIGATTTMRVHGGPPISSSSGVYSAIAVNKVPRSAEQTEPP